MDKDMQTSWYAIPFFIYSEMFPNPDYSEGLQKGLCALTLYSPHQLVDNCMTFPLWTLPLLLFSHFGEEKQFFIHLLAFYRI